MRGMEDRVLMQAFVEKRGIALPIGVLSGKPPDCFSSRAIPATFILDEAGTIAFRHVGAATRDDGGVVAFVRGLAATPKAG